MYTHSSTLTFSFLDMYVCTCRHIQTPSLTYTQTQKTFEHTYSHACMYTHYVHKNKQTCMDAYTPDWHQTH